MLSYKVDTERGRLTMMSERAEEFEKTTVSPSKVDMRSLSPSK